MKDKINQNNSGQVVAFPRRRKSPPVTREMALLMHRLRGVGLAQHEIAAHLGVNQGRVCEVLKGRRFPDLLTQGSLF